MKPDEIETRIAELIPKSHLTGKDMVWFQRKEIVGALRAALTIPTPEPVAYLIIAHTIHQVVPASKIPELQADSDVHSFEIVRPLPAMPIGFLLRTRTRLSAEFDGRRRYVPLIYLGEYMDPRALQYNEITFIYDFPPT